jgi:hypothetical protein
MNVDSQIAAEVLKHFTDRNSPVLCVHDSFIIKHTQSQELVEVMKDTTTRFLGGPLRVSQTFPGLDQFLKHPDNKASDYFEWRKFPDRSDGYYHRWAKFRERQEKRDEIED